MGFDKGLLLALTLRISLKNERSTNETWDDGMMPIAAATTIDAASTCVLCRPIMFYSSTDTMDFSASKNVSLFHVFFAPQNMQFRTMELLKRIIFQGFIIFGGFHFSLW
jgi:hypothetical protein